MRRLVRRCLAAIGWKRAEVEDDLSRELASHLALLEDEQRRRGLTAEGARLAARRAMGSVALARDLHRDARSFTWLEDVRQDLRQVARSVRRTPAFVAAVALTLGLGIGAATTMFSVVYGVLLRPLPYPDPDRLVRLWERHPGASTPNGDLWLSNLTYHAWNGQSRQIGPIGTYGGVIFTVRFDEPTRLAGARLSPSVTEVLGISAAIGRFFIEDDAREGATPVVVLSHDLWRDRFGARLSAVGRTLMIDERPHVIVGVAPPGFAFPGPDSRLWTAASLPPPTVDAGNVRIAATRAVARLAGEATPAQAAAEGTAIARAQARPPIVDVLWGRGGPVEVEVLPLVDDMTAGVRPALLLAILAVGSLLLIACSNVANLLLVRGVSRQREIAVRTALGAGRGRLVRQLLTESVAMSALGGVLGVALALALVRALPAFVPQRFPRLDDVRVDGLMLAVACAVTVVAGVLSGLVPALRGTGGDLAPSAREGGGSSAGARGSIARRVLLAGEAALAVMLLVVALMVGRSLAALLNVDAGYDAGNVITAQVDLPDAARGQAQTDAFVPAVLERIRKLPGVLSAGAGSMGPFGRLNMSTELTVPVPGRAPVSARSRVYVVTAGYAETLRLRLLAGRLLDESDLASGTQAMLVNEEFVRTFLQGAEPVGFMTDGLLARGTRAEVVGVVGNVLKDGLNTSPQPEVYVVPAHRYSLRNEIHLVARISADPAAIMPALRSIVHELRNDAAIDDLTTLEAQTLQSVGTERFATKTLAGLALAAVLLAAVGLYAVLSQVVAARTRELGVRTALGASGARIARTVIGDGMRTTGVGLLIGSVAAAGVAQLMQSMLFGIAPLDPVSFVFAAFVLGVAAFVACVLPARRAARIDPMAALRKGE